MKLLSAKNISKAWIGLISSQWSDAALTTFRSWAGDQPGEGTLLNGCAATSNNSGMWNYNDCAMDNPFICYGSSNPPQRRQYHFVNKPMTWTQALLYCTGRFSALATADSVGDVVGMMNAVNLLYNGSVWIGLSRASSATWAWSSRDLLDFKNWDTGRPNGTGSCGVSVRSVWRDYNCTTPLYFVCFQAGVGYIGVNISKSWQDAQSYCRQQYTDLATINSPWQQKLLTGIFGRGLAVWVGLFLDTWQWSDQWSLFFRNWAVGQPTYVAGNCITMMTNDSGNWADAPCNTENPVMCYGDVDKLKRKQIISVNVSSDGTADLNNPTLQATMLNRIQQALKIQASDKNAAVSWIQEPSGKVFVLKPKVIQNNHGC
ncbi:macrophage mannose receptor 1-like [Brachyhypopomus gauderio]|uniref:macrophage mannose receptor 1-like n=1 Tax=Brachyhypopomus gauderio TaxID=698409 RepID=UPI004042ACB2